MTLERVEADLAVIGCGLAGVAAAVCAARQGMRVVILGSTGGIVFTSGYFDVFGVMRTADGALKDIDAPWDAVSSLGQNEPKHPFVKLPVEAYRAAMDDFQIFLTEAGVPYVNAGDGNFSAISPSGTLKRTWAMPATMRGGVDMLGDDAPCLFVDFAGLKGFSARQIMANLSAIRPNLRAETVKFPDFEDYEEVYAEHMARALEVPENLEKLADVIRPLMKDARYVGLPAILGVHGPDAILSRLSELLGVTVFEVPSLPPSLPGIRLREAFEYALPQRGVTVLPRKNALEARMDAEGFEIMAGAREAESIVRARGVVLATGRFLGGGLRGERKGVRETVFGLPVAQPADRSKWHSLEYFDSGGHGINRAGVEVDGAFRPVDASGQVVHPQLYAAGSILAHQDWIRSRCGAGLAIATAVAAVRSFCGESR